MIRRLTSCVLTCAIGAISPAYGQFGRGGDWTTSGNDAQRSSWLRSDPKISMASMQKPGFQFLWKMKLDNAARQLNSLTTPVLMDRLIGYKGFRSLAFVGGSSDKVFVMDTDLARMEWQIQLPGAAPQQGTPECPGGLTSALTRPTSLPFPQAPGAGGGGGGFGRGGPAKSGVGEPDQGAITLTIANAPRPGGPGGPPGGPGGPGGPGARPGRPGAGGPPGGSGGFGAPSAVFALSSSGMIHTLNVQNGLDAQPPVKFLPPNANASGLILVDYLAYATTDQSCGGAPNGVWALDFATKQVTNWTSTSGIAGTGGPALGPDGTVYVTTKGGDLAALEPATLKHKASYKAGQEFSSSPVLFEFKGKTLAAAATTDGRLHLLDTAALATPLDKSASYSSASDFRAGALSSWQDAAGTRWVLAPSAGAVPPDARFTVSNGSVASGAIVAWKVVDRNGAPALETGWVSRDMISPLPPMIINGVIFAVASGEFRGDPKLTAAQRAQRSAPAVLYALDGATGKELWSSGKTITSFAHSGGLSAGGSQLYLGTYDGTLYAFGFPIEH